MTDYKPYTGSALQNEGVITIPGFEEKIPPYFPGPSLTEAVEYARLLQRPLLLRGEPGCGKTRVAQAVAYELYGDTYRSHYFEWFVKSTSKATEGLYRFDHIKKMRDGQMGVSNLPQTYRELGPLGKAFQNSTTEKPAVLLIDEIDKADLDFPNDLLLELDQKRFVIPETGESIVAGTAPIVFITSNDEKELSNAFLRRCVFCYIAFPGKDDLTKIVNAHLDRFITDNRQKMPGTDIDKLVTRFNELYEDMKKAQSDKHPSTSELIDWARLLQHYANGVRFPVDGDKEILPYAEVLLKTLDDYKKYRTRNASPVQS